MSSAPSNAEQVQASFQQALAFHQQGQLAQAQALYQEILRAQPAHADALHLLGVIAHQTGQSEIAVDLIGRAIRVNSAQPVFFYNHGNALSALGQLEAAVASYIQAIRLQPQFPEAFASLGSAFLGLRQFDHAVTAFERAIALQPGVADWHFNRGIALLEIHRCEAALASFDQALALKADFAEAHANRGKALVEVQQWTAALESYGRALELKPDLAEAYVGRGHALQALHRLEAAIADFDRAIELKPQLAQAHCNRGGALQALKRLQGAVASYDRAIELAPDYAQAHSNRGNALREMKQLKAAVASYGRAIELKPDYAEAYANRGIVLQELDQLPAAVADFAKAIELMPDYEFLYGHLVHARMGICDWGHFDDDLARLSAGIRNREKVSPTFALIPVMDSPSLQRQAAEIFARTMAAPDTTLGPLKRGPDKEKIRIGYFSADFHAHATTHLIARMFELHDKSRFELFAFSFDPDAEDDMRRRISCAFDRFVDVGQMSDLEVTRLSRELEIDIAVDLKGFTQYSRFGIFAGRAAPVQVGYLGYPGTMGAEYMDYIIADERVIPESSRPHYTEKVVWLPHSYQVNDATRPISDGHLLRQAFGLPPTGFVFCCFNGNYKITPAVFDVWMRLLQRVDGSVLWLIRSNPDSLENLRRQAGQRGVDPDRLVFADRRPQAEHLARHRLADIFVDTLPCNAHTTASDALWAGLPVLTCAGQTFAGRVAASLLHALNLPELVTGSLPEYEALALELARHPEQLAALRTKLAQQRLSAPLFDTALFTRHLEAAYEAMWRRHLAGQPPDHIVIPPGTPTR